MAAYTLRLCLRYQSSGTEADQIDQGGDGFCVSRWAVGSLAANLSNFFYLSVEKNNRFRK